MWQQSRLLGPTSRNPNPLHPHRLRLQSLLRRLFGSLHQWRRCSYRCRCLRLRHRHPPHRLPHRLRHLRLPKKGLSRRPQRRLRRAGSRNLPTA